MNKTRKERQEAAKALRLNRDLIDDESESFAGVYHYWRRKADNAADKVAQATHALERYTARRRMELKKANEGAPKWELDDLLWYEDEYNDLTINLTELEAQQRSYKSILAALEKKEKMILAIRKTKDNQAFFDTQTRLNDNPNNGRKQYA